MQDNPGIVDPPHADLYFTAWTNAPRFHAELGAVFGERLLGVGTGPYGTVVHLKDQERDADRKAVESVLAKHNPTPAPAPPTQEELIVQLMQRIATLEGKVK